MSTTFSRTGFSLCRAALLGLAALWAMAGGLAQAQPIAAEVDPPGRVARVAEVHGQVWLYSPDTGEWIGAVRNRPVTSGDRLATDAGARVELDIGSATVRLDSASELEVVRLDDNRVALQLHSGSAAARIRDARAVGQFELTTADGRFRVQSAGRYRFDVLDRASDVTVSTGQAIYEGPGSALTVYSGQRGEFWLDSKGAAQYTLTDPVLDAFAGWNNERDRKADRLATVRYVSPEMVGAADLDRYGRWEQSADYGAVWYPRGVETAWAPYSAGHWAWVRPWGWTWVDDAPWGFAPFHYGRWVFYRSAWCWAPGRVVARPVYAPALVAWIGGPQVNVSVGVGGPPVGWFPLAPREVYVPGYRASPRYVREINVTHVTNITNINNVIVNPPREYQNRRYPNAVTMVPATVLTNREPVAPNAARFRNSEPMRNLANQPVQPVATATPPVVAPPVSTHGVDSRPFGPRTTRPGEGNGEPEGRSRLPPNEASSRGPHAGPAAAPPVAPVAPVVPAVPAVPALPAISPAPAAVVPAGPGGRSFPNQRPGQDRRDGMQPMVPPPPVTAGPAVAPAVTPPRVLPTPAAPTTIQPTPVVPAVVPAPPSENGPRFRRGPDERLRPGVPQSVPPGVTQPSPAPAAVPAPAPIQRSEAGPAGVPPPPRVAPPPPPQVAPRPVRVEPPVPVIRAPEAPRPVAPAEAGAPRFRTPEARGPEARPPEPGRPPRPEGPPGARDERREPGERPGGPPR